MDRAKYQSTAPAVEHKDLDAEQGDKFSSQRKNYRKKGKVPGGRSGKGKVVSATRSTFKKHYRG